MDDKDDITGNDIPPSSDSEGAGGPDGGRDDYSLKAESPGKQNGINQGIPAVASGGTKNVFFLAITIIVAGILIFNIFSSDDIEQQSQEEKKETGGIVQKTEDFIPPPPPALPPPPPPAPPPPPPPSSSSSEDGTDGEGMVSENAGSPLMKGLSLPPERRKANAVVSGDALPAGSFLEGGVEGGTEKTGIGKPTSVQVDATLAGNPIDMIAQGKIIDSVLETAINSDLSGILRAVVSRDVYAEAGKRILIPKGSRLVGSYDVTVKRGQSRVFIVWNRVLRPDGIDVVITSPGSDQLGRAGVEGNVDDRYLDVFSNAILFSSMTVAFAYGAEKAIDSEGLSEKENTSGSVTTSGKPSDIAVVEAIDDFGDVVKKVATEVVDLRPTITIDQGTPMKVFVNKDLLFPNVITSEVVYIK